MAIRIAKGKDLLKVESLLDRFYNSKDFNTLGVPYDRDSILELSLNMILSNEAMILINESDGNIGGVIGMQKTPLPFNKNYFALTESFWFANDGSGIKLLRAVEGIAKLSGIKFMAVVSLFGMKSDKINRVLGHMGYNRLENHLIKEIK